MDSDTIVVRSTMTTAVVIDFSTRFRLPGSFIFQLLDCMPPHTIYLTSVAIRISRFASFVPAGIDYPPRRAIAPGIARVNRRARENTVSWYRATDIPRRGSKNVPRRALFPIGRDSSMSDTAPAEKSGRIDREKTTR